MTTTLRTVDNRGPQEMTERERYLEERVAALFARIEDMNERLVQKDKRIAELEARIDDLEYRDLESGL